MPFVVSLLTTALWGNPLFVWTVAVVAAILLTASWWLLRFARRRRIRAAAACVSLSILLHALLFFLMPMLRKPAGGTPEGSGEIEAVVADVTFADLDPEQPLDEMSGREATHSLRPLPIAPPPVRPQPSEPTPSAPTPEPEPPPVSEDVSLATEMEQLLSTPSFAPETEGPADEALDAMLSHMLLPEAPSAEPQPSEAGDATSDRPPAPADPPVSPEGPQATSPPSTAAAEKRVVNDQPNDFAQRFGEAKQAALRSTGGDQQTEAAVEAGLRWLARYQRTDGSWDPLASGAGRERAPLGLRRDAAGKKATTGLTGLALLSMLGAGNTHREGPYARHVYDGLSYLIRSQAPDGSLAGEAGTFARTYSHGMAALALCEAAAITSDPQALSAAKAAIGYTVRLQHPVTGGWRYVSRDRGDLSQLGWQAMVLDSGRRGGLPIPQPTQAGIFRFLESVREGRHGGLATYRAGERPTPTMTAEALATRLLLGEKVPAAEVAEAERLMLQSVPGTEQANYYYWYYASLALHQLQDEAWHTWNQHLKETLTSTQQEDGSWPTDSLWGGYGGRVYTTAVGCLCLEVYYRHTAAPPRRLAGAEQTKIQR